MNRPINDKPHVLFLFSDTGGGHRSAAEALIEAIDLEFNDQITTEMVDFFIEYAPPPLDLAPVTYPPMAHMPEMWKLGFQLSDNPRRTRAINRMFWPYVSRAAHRLIEEHPCDLIVSVHPVVNTTILRALGQENRTPYLTIVTDLVTTHAFWFNNWSDLIIVATPEARDRAIHYGIQPDRVRVLGLPVADRFCQPPGDCQALRTRLGWPQDKPVILLVGGGEGMGPLERTAHAIARSGKDVALVIVTGRNQKLKEHLDEQAWPIPTFVYGFVREMPDFMRAADVLVTKAGPGTISEAFIAGLPIILYSRMPGQEDGNVDYVVSQGAGVWAPQPKQVITALDCWLANPAELQKVAAACRRLARPQASRNIARVIASHLGV
jgi:1,2-diacylglycerol 3-beta-galactosyltransferase